MGYRTAPCAWCGERWAEVTGDPDSPRICYPCYYDLEDER